MPLSDGAPLPVRPWITRGPFSYHPRQTVVVLAQLTLPGFKSEGRLVMPLMPLLAGGKH
jgi:hypothetical protein